MSEYTAKNNNPVQTGASNTLTLSLEDSKRLRENSTVRRIVDESIRERDATITILIARVAELEDQLKRQHLGHLQWLDAGEKAGFVFSTGKDGFAMEHNPELNLTLRNMTENGEIADLIAQLSAMTQERDANGAQQDEAGKQLMDFFARWWNTTSARATTAETALRDAREFETRGLAEKIVDWLSDQKYQGEEILHAIVCCDYASRHNLITSVARLIDAALSAAPQTEAQQAGEPTGTDDDNLSRRFVDAARALLPAQEKCPNCGGSGIDKIASWADDNLVVCPACHGTGWKVQNG